MEDGIFFNDGTNNKYLGVYDAESNSAFLTTVKKAANPDLIVQNGVWIIDSYEDPAKPYWSSIRNGFYIPLISTSIPTDAIQISKELYKELLTAQANGSTIYTSENGLPAAKEKDISIPELSGIKHDELEATKSTLGHMVVGVGLTVDPGGIVNIAPASTNGIGGVKIGSGLTVNDETGELSVISESSLPGYNNTDAGKLLAINSSGTDIEWAAANTALQSTALQIVQGVMHYKDIDGWHTLEPAGKIIASLSPVPPAGTLLCDGSTYDTSFYTELYAVLNGTYGSNLPNLAGRAPIGAGRYAYSEVGGSFIDIDYQVSLKGYGGSVNTRLTANNLPEHNHYLSSSYLKHRHSLSTGSISSTGSHSHSITSYITSKNGTDDGIEVLAYDKGGVPTTTRSTASAGTHSHSLTGYSSYSFSDTTTNYPTTSYGQGDYFKTISPYLVVYYYIYTGKVLIS